MFLSVVYIGQACYNNVLIKMDALRNLYNNFEKKELIASCFQLSMSNDPMPMDDIHFILDDTRDIEVVAAILDALVQRISDVDEALMTTIYPKASDDVKKYIVMVLSRALCWRYYLFLLDEYFCTSAMRPIIRKQAFRHKAPLLINLARYVDGKPLTDESVTVAQSILRTIPLAVIRETGVMLSGTIIMDMYYAMKPSTDQPTEVSSNYDGPVER